MKIILLILGSLLKINVVHCQISNINCSPELYSKVEILKGESLFFVNLDEKLSDNNLGGETILLQNYQKKFPGTIILNFSKEKALYQIEVEDKQLVISEFGNILQSNQKNNTLTKVIWETTGQHDHSKIAKIINSTKNDNLKVNKITWKNNSEIIIEIEDSPRVILDNKAIDSKLSALVIILTSREIKDYAETIKEIDLRFNLPVLRTTQ